MTIRFIIGIQGFWVRNTQDPNHVHTAVHSVGRVYQVAAPSSAEVYAVPPVLVIDVRQVRSRIRYSTFAIWSFRVARGFAARCADIRIPRRSVSPVHDLRRHLGELVRSGVPADLGLGALYTGQLRQWWRQRWVIANCRRSYTHRSHDVLLLHHRPQHARAYLALRQVRNGSGSGRVQPRVGSGQVGS